MELYHYASSKFDVLKTLNKQGKSYKEKSDKADYGDHVSFFFERPPLSLLGDIFGNDHHVWFPGSVLYEYTVKGEDLSDFRYSVVEYPEKTDALYNTALSDAQYFTLCGKAKEKWRYNGSTLEDLEFALKHLKGTTEKYFKLMKTRSNFDEIKKKYAATVPHLMIYPKSGEIKISKTKKVTVDGTVKANESIIQKWAL